MTDALSHIRDLVTLMRENRVLRIKTSEMEVELHPLSFVVTEAKSVEPERSPAAQAVLDRRADPFLCACGHSMIGDHINGECVAEAADGIAAACSYEMCHPDQGTLKEDAEP